MLWNQKVPYLFRISFQIKKRNEWQTLAEYQLARHFRNIWQ